MNNKAQLDEISPVGIIGGLICGLVAFIVEKNVNVSFVFKVGAFLAGCVVGYLVVAKMADS